MGYPSIISAAWLPLFGIFIACPVSSARAADTNGPAAEFIAPRREVTDLEAAETIRQQVAVRKSQEQADRVAAAKLRRIRRTQIAQNGGTLIRNQVVPPVLPSAPPVATRVEPTMEHAVRWERLTEKHQRMLMLSATVYDHRLTHLRWEHDGQSYTAWSNVDFHYLRGVTEFETADTCYLVFMGIGDTTSEDFAAANRVMDESGIDGYEPKRLPEQTGFMPDQAEYFIETAPELQPDPAALAGLDALHAYYQRNAAQLQTDYRNTEKLNAAREQYEAAHPAAPRVNVLTFWMGGQAARESTAPSMPAPTALPAPQ